MEAYNFRIVNAGCVDQRGYVSFYVDGKRLREYNGNRLNLNLHPNRTKSISDKRRLLGNLKSELVRAIKSGTYANGATTVSVKNYPRQEIELDRMCVESLLDEALGSKLGANLSQMYIKNLKSLVMHFKAFLSKAELEGDFSGVTLRRVQEFLDGFRSSGINYMNKRRELGAIFSTISRNTDLPITLVQRTPTAKRKAKLHRPYEAEEMRQLLDFLRERHENLHLCCLICYGCFLRPHQEIRNLRVENIKRDCSEIHLSGAENKSGAIRIVYIPDYVRAVLLDRINKLPPGANIFTGKDYAYGVSYFHVQWQRLRKVMYERNLLEPLQTIYSFRHSAAVNVYRKTKDISIVQKLMGHSDMVVTLKYLRSLGEYNDERLRAFMPEL